ncbi:sugar kinase [Virgibacillus dokdonensis]|uniref:2-dehydro-3-deoxygluconokinase n=1 Tax=Virgibacillus dokdonensis TaxID=302167 RepID=A0A2K9J3V5_9BACI|nr:sugar kinase [Virgibacillus dokdonensis]AUJ23670.1 2-dehydro-3-deoxygluconokinase [Virgibacillus dokdonensis]
MKEVNSMIKAFGEVMMRLEVPNHLKLEQATELGVLYSGTGINVLSALSRFGHSTSIITKLPDNALGDAAISYIRSLGIETSDIITGGNYLGMYFLEKGYHVRKTNVTYSNRKESSFCTSKITDYNVEEVLRGTSILHLCGIMLSISEQMRYNALTIAKKAKQLGITVVFDFNYRPKLWQEDFTQAKKWYECMLAYVDICFMTDMDALFILRMESTEKSRKQRMKQLIPEVAKKYNVATIAGSLRDQENQQICGFLYQQDVMYFSRTYQYQVLDRIGSGDAYASGILHGILKKFTDEDTVDFATAACVLAHTTYGDSPICSEEEIWLLAKQNNVQIER